MKVTGLFEHTTHGNHHTWSKKHTNGIIYSRIDRAIFNKSWFMKFPNSEIEILAPHISDHAPLKVVMDPDIPSRKKFQPRFKFLNSLVDDANFLETVRDS